LPELKDDDDDDNDLVTFGSCVMIHLFTKPWTSVRPTTESTEPALITSTQFRDLANPAEDRGA